MCQNCAHTMWYWRFSMELLTAVPSNRYNSARKALELNSISLFWLPFKPFWDLLHTYARSLNNRHKSKLSYNERYRSLCLAISKNSKCDSRCKFPSKRASKTSQSYFVQNLSIFDHSTLLKDVKDSVSYESGKRSVNWPDERFVFVYLVEDRNELNAEDFFWAIQSIHSILNWLNSSGIRVLLSQ